MCRAALKLGASPARVLGCIFVRHTLATCLHDHSVLGDVRYPAHCAMDTTIRELRGVGYVEALQILRASTPARAHLHAAVARMHKARPTL